MSGSVLIRFFCLSSLIFTLSANDFSEIRHLIYNSQYKEAISAIETAPINNFAKKRLVILLAHTWNELTPKEQKRIDNIVSELMPADRAVIERIIDHAPDAESRRVDVEQALATPSSSVEQPITVKPSDAGLTNADQPVRAADVVERPTDTARPAVVKQSTQATRQTSVAAKKTTVQKKQTTKTAASQKTRPTQKAKPSTQQKTRAQTAQTKKAPSRAKRAPMNRRTAPVQEAPPVVQEKVVEKKVEVMSVREEL